MRPAVWRPADAQGGYGFKIRAMPATDDIRLFLALWPDEAVADALHAASGRLQGLCGGRRMRRDTLHLTLVFLGNTPRSRLPALMAALAQVALMPAELRLDHYGRWRPGITWLGPSDPPAALLQLVDKLRATLDELGLKYDRKAFKPHVTMLRHGHPPAAWPDDAPLVWPIRGFRLVASSTEGEQGPEYQELESYQLDA